MTWLESVSGTGRLVVNEKDLGKAEYEISAYHPRYPNQFCGTIWANWKHLKAAMDSINAMLILEGGHLVEIFVVSVTPRENNAPINVIGELSRP